jgi:hypothetical protein
MCIWRLFNDVKLLSEEMLCGDCSMCCRARLEENAKVLDVIRAVMYKSGSRGRGCVWKL